MLRRCTLPDCSLHDTLYHLLIRSLCFSNFAQRIEVFHVEQKFPLETEIDERVRRELTDPLRRSESSKATHRHRRVRVERVQSASTTAV